MIPDLQRPQRITFRIRDNSIHPALWNVLRSDRFHRYGHTWAWWPDGTFLYFDKARKNVPDDEERKKPALTATLHSDNGGALAFLLFSNFLDEDRFGPADEDERQQKPGHLVIQVHESVLRNGGLVGAVELVGRLVEFDDPLQLGWESIEMPTDVPVPFSHIIRRVFRKGQLRGRQRSPTSVDWKRSRGSIAARIYDKVAWAKKYQDKNPEAARLLKELDGRPLTRVEVVPEGKELETLLSVKRPVLEDAMKLLDPSVNPFRNFIRLERTKEPMPDDDFEDSVHWGSRFSSMKARYLVVEELRERAADAETKDEKRKYDYNRLFTSRSDFAEKLARQNRRALRVFLEPLEELVKPTWEWPTVDLDDVIRMVGDASIETLLEHVDALINVLDDRDAAPKQVRADVQTLHHEMIVRVALAYAAMVKRRDGEDLVKKLKLDRRDVMHQLHQAARKRSDEYVAGAIDFGPLTEDLEVVKRAFRTKTKTGKRARVTKSIRSALPRMLHHCLVVVQHLESLHR